MSEIIVRLALSYPQFRLAVDLVLPGRGVTALFGHSGSGKTSCLRAIAGLERAEQALVQVNGEIWQDTARRFYLPPQSRSLGYVFQEASLFEHLTVRRNLEYGWRRTPAAQRRIAFDQAVAMLGVEPLLERMPQRLSGGERQRVAIARALLTSPQLLLLDEPLAALDAQRKAEILPYLQSLHDELEIPMLYVSHSVDEVARLADYLVLMEGGQVRAAGPLFDLLPRLDLPTAQGEDAGVAIATRLLAHDDAYALSQLTFDGGELWVSRVARPLGSPLRARVLARDVSLARSAASDSSMLNILPAEVLALHDDGDGRVLVRLALGKTALLARITRRSCDALALQAGERVFAQIKSVALVA